MGHGLEATGGTAINDALAAALALREKNKSRTFTIVFFTDGMPTIGETRPEKILQNVAAKNSGDTRIFTFGVGDDVNAALLDQLADTTRAVSTYVRESEDIESKVSSLYSKISNPVLANLKLTVGSGVTSTMSTRRNCPTSSTAASSSCWAVTPARVQVAVTLTGTVGGDTKEFVYELTFPEKTLQEKAFVEDLWARRKVGFMLDQIRAQRREQRTGSRSHYARQALRHHDPLHELSGGARWRSAKTLGHATAKPKAECPLRRATYPAGPGTWGSRRLWRGGSFVGPAQTGNVCPGHQECRCHPGGRAAPA